MMIKIKYGLSFLIIALGVTVSCKKDDSVPPPIPPRDRGAEAVRAQGEIETFLETHFYNYDDFQADPENFVIKFDTIAGDNASKTPLMNQVSSKVVTDRLDTDVKYKLYFLKVREGGGVKPHFSDFAINKYEGRLMDLSLFDSSVIPLRFDLNEVIVGLSQAMIEFRGGVGEPVTNPDGSVSFQDYGIGAVFIPSGLGYFQYPPGNKDLEPYGQLIFSFDLYSSTIADHDEDGIPSYMEDLNNNQFLLDDDTDGDGKANYLDNDDDGDGRLTEYEIDIDAEGNITFPDKNGNGILDYLDKSI